MRHHVTGVSAVSEAERDRAATLLPGVPVKPIPDVVSGAHLVVLAIPDDVLAELIAGLATTGTFTAGQLVMHTSGAYGISVFESAIGSDLVPLALHPAMTFTGRTSISSAPGLLLRRHDRGHGAALAEALVIEMGGDPVWVPEEERLTYHAALAHGANHLVTLVSQAMELLRDAGIEEPSRCSSRSCPAALANTLQQGDLALTGPRGARRCRYRCRARGAAPRGGPGHPADLPRTRPGHRAALLSGRLKASAADALLELLADEEDNS